MADWGKAAEQYRKNNPETKQAEGEKDLVYATHALTSFLDSPEWMLAEQLLRESKQVIHVGHQEHNGTGCTYLVNEKGLQLSCAPAGMSAAYTQQPNIPTMKDISTIEFIRSVSQCEDGKKPLEILPFIKSELDRIAEAAPKE